MFETKRELREKIELLTEMIEDLNGQLIKARSDAAYYGDRYDYYMRECLSLKREIRASKRISEAQAKVGTNLIEENEELNKRINILNKCLDADNALIDKLRKEKEAGEPEFVTLGDFDKAMDRIADKYDLILDKTRTSIERKYIFINRESPFFNRSEITIDIDRYKLKESWLKQIENNVVFECGKWRE